MNRSVMAACQSAATARRAPLVVSKTGDNHKQRATTAAKCALIGATFTVTEDDYGDPLFVVSLGAATCLFQSLQHVEEWLDELSEVSPC
jgi:hypothetical protein